jgi:transcription factor C subunit 6
MKYVEYVEREADAEFRRVAKARRQSRGKTVKSYRIEDEYKFLDSENEAESSKDVSNRRARDEDEDSDTFEPPAQDEEPEDEVMEEEDAADGDEAESEVVEGDLDDVEDEQEASGRKRGRGKKASTARRKKEPPAAPISTAAAAGLFVPKRVIPKKTRKPNPAASGLPPPKKESQTPLDRMHTRGVDEWGRGARGGSLENRVKDLFGPGFRDLQPVIQTRDRWMEQNTLPSREEHIGRSFFTSDGSRERAIKRLRDWYQSSGSVSFSQGQHSKILSKEDGLSYLAHDGPSSLRVLLGFNTDPQLYSLEARSSISTSAPFKAREDRRGWIINLGTKVQDAQWAPIEDGTIQYLAVAVKQPPPNANQHKPFENPQAPAFSPTVKFPASIQIWSFQSTEPGMLDEKAPPRLEAVLCTDWGAPKQLRWCPFSATESSGEDSQNVKLGLLASRWSDGRVRILDVSYPKPDPAASEPLYIQYTRCAFEVSFPKTVPTCMQWLSGTSLAVGTAAGTVAIWTLTRSDCFPPAREPLESQHNPRPWFYEQIADTFIVTLASGFPSRPQFISITTADGYAKLIDLRDPVADTVNASRGRIFAITQAWHEQTQSFIMPEEVLQLRSNTIRRYYSNIQNIRSDAQIVLAATSPVHPSVLVGCADGRVSATNPVPRVMNYKEIPWQQTWFKHEWRPSVDKLAIKAKPNEAPDTNRDAGPSRTTNVPPDLLKQPLARMSEGYKVSQNQLQPYKPGPNPTAPHSKDFIKPITIYEEPSCVTALAWNPNLKFGTWAVAGMGDGLLRVEDLGV